MPAQIIPSEPGLSVPRYSVIGKYANGPGSTLVKHLGLVREDGSIEHGSEVMVWHMQPPLVAGNQESKCAAHVAGWLVLTTTEREGIADWLAEVDKENRPDLNSSDKKFESLLEQYSVTFDLTVPWHHDERGIRIYRRFSCVTFVLEAYSVGANIRLLDVSDSEKLPAARLETITQTYQLARNIHVREKIGIPDPGPWRIPLPGYICHSMNRTDELIRATPYLVPGIEAASFPMPEREDLDA